MIFLANYRVWMLIYLDLGGPCSTAWPISNQWPSQQLSSRQKTYRALCHFSDHLHHNHMFFWIRGFEVKLVQLHADCAKNRVRVRNLRMLRARKYLIIYLKVIKLSLSLIHSCYFLRYISTTARTAFSFFSFNLNELSGYDSWSSTRLKLAFHRWQISPLLPRRKKINFGSLLGFVSHARFRCPGENVALYLALFPGFRSLS